MRTELSDGTIFIRRYRAEDLNALFEAARESIGGTFTRWAPWCHEGYSLEDSSAFISRCEEGWDKGEEYGFAVLDVQTGAFFGGAGLNQFNHQHKFANLGYWVRRSRMGRGIATAATLLTARFGFEDLGLHRAEIVISTENTASQRVAEKAKATREGILRNRILIGGRLHDAVMYSLIPADMNVE